MPTSAFRRGLAAHEPVKKCHAARRTLDLACHCPEAASSPGALSSVGTGRTPKVYYPMGQPPSIWRPYNDIAVHRTTHPAVVPDTYSL
jgi:hypothetical protein